MRGILLFSALILLAGPAAASIPPHQAVTQPEPALLGPSLLSPALPAPTFRLSGSVFLQPRPLPGTVLHYPGIFTPLRGPHGGLLAQRQQDLDRG